MDRFAAKVMHDVATMGWSGISVGGDETARPFSYSIGLSGRDLPDIVVVGLAGVTGHTLIHELLELDQPLELGREYHKVARDLPVRLVEPLPGVMEEMHQSRAFHEAVHPDKPWRALQLLWPDPSGKFPGEEGWDSKFQQTIEVARTVH